jgi:hypothetical protein
MPRPTPAHLIGLFASTLLLASCGGGGGDSPSPASPAAVTQQTINGIDVPPAPDRVANAATIGGVDSNQNGIRDDVERLIAQESSTKVHFETASKLAKAYQELITSPISTDLATAMAFEKKIHCSVTDISLFPDSLLSHKEASLENLIFDTEDRKDKLRAAREFIGGYDGSEINCAN